MRQEQIVFTVALLALGGMSYQLFAGSTVPLRGGERGGEGAELTHHRAPDTGIVLPSAGTPPLARELFAPPRDTLPLAPLQLVEPPRQRLAVLLPPTEPGPLPAAYGRLLRRALPLTEKPELFAAAEEAEVEPGDFLELDDNAKSEQPRVPAGDKTQRDPFAGETPDERQARITGYKQRYDWLQVGPGDLWFGRIENADRYGLGLDSTRAAEPFSFVRLDPETGRELFANVGAPPLSVERERATSFGFADTIANGIELRARRLAGELTRGSFDEALALGAYCVRNRLEAPRALVIAEELYQRAVRYDPKDPAPRLGLARCLEAAFQFEQAFATYEALLLDFAHREEVHVAMAELEEKLLLHDAAEQRLRAALTRNQGSWITRFGLGRFLLARGRASEAHEHLKVAWQAAPQVPELADVRATIRTTLADAQFALGELAEAESTYRSTLAGDAKNERAKAGLLACETLAGKAPAAEGAPTGAGFELLLARGVADLANAKHESARDLLRLAAEADPLRAHKAYGALSVLAEVTGNGEEALRLADEALERDPTDAFALFQRGRLLGLQDDYEGARAALSGALEQELDFTDALIALGDVAFRLGRFDDAERYLERAVALDGSRAEVHALRGLNLLRLNRVGDARASFERGLEVQRDDSTSAGGLAWCLYLEGDPGEAQIRLAAIVDSRRGVANPEQDPWRLWAETQNTRLGEHLKKVEWRDAFARRRLGNSWQTREASGVTVTLTDGVALVTGQFERNGDARLYRQFDGGEFLSFEADVTIDAAKASGKFGLYAAKEKAGRAGSEPEVTAEAAILRHPDGNLQVRFVRSGQAPEERDMQQPFPLGKTVRLKIARSGEGSDTSMTLFLDGIPVVENVKTPGLGQAKTPMLVGFFVEGDNGRAVEARLDNVSVVTRLP